MPAELPTPSKAAHNPRLRPRNETIPPRRSFLRGLGRSLGMGFSRENLVAGLVAGAAASRGILKHRLPMAHFSTLPSLPCAGC